MPSNREPLKSGEKVAAYYNGQRSVGWLAWSDQRWVVRPNPDGSGAGVIVHPKQIRRLVKCERREVWLLDATPTPAAVEAAKRIALDADLDDELMGTIQYYALIHHIAQALDVFRAMGSKPSAIPDSKLYEKNRIEPTPEAVELWRAIRDHAAGDCHCGLCDGDGSAWLLKALDAFSSARVLEAVDAEREAIAQMLDRRETDLGKASGNTYYQQAECNIAARWVRARGSKPADDRRTGQHRDGCHYFASESGFCNKCGNIGIKEPLK